MNSTYLQTFITLAKTGSFTKTAQMMVVVPSTISKQIKLLEEELGCTLLIRDKKTVRLTSAGEALLKHARQILEIENACKTELSGLEDSDVNLRIGTVYSLFQTHVAVWLSRYLNSYPNTRARIVTDHSAMQLNMLYDGELDICFSYNSFQENGCVCIPFVRDELILVTGKQNTEYIDGVTIDKLRALPLIRETQLEVSDPLLDKQIFGHNKNVLLSMTTGNLVVPVLKAGTGYGFVVRRYVEQELMSGQLREVSLLGFKTKPLQSFLIYKKSNTLVQPSLVEHILTYAEEKSML